MWLRNVVMLGQNEGKRINRNTKNRAVFFAVDDHGGVMTRYDD